MTKLDKLKLERYAKRLGAMTSQEALMFAIEAEKTVKDLGPYDMATKIFIQQRIDYEKYALLLENSGL